MPAARSYPGLYRATVLSNLDPELLCRLQLTIPQVFGAIPSAWALPCLPFAEPGTRVILPPVGALVWVQFEQGDVDHPVWMGCFWTDAATAPVGVTQP